MSGRCKVWWKLQLQVQVQYLYKFKKKMFSVCLACFFYTVSSMLSSFTPLSVQLSSVQLFNCIIKPFSYSSHSVSLPPLFTRSVPSYSFKSMKLHRPFLSPWLDEYCSLPSSEYFSFLLCLLPLAFTLSILSSSSPCHSFSSCLSVCHPCWTFSLFS